jgi:selenide,water dikinase
VATTDFLTPVVDDPRTWGRIAAQNAASDVYAMGGRPLFALNLVAWPSSELPTSMLAEVMAGGAEIGVESGFPVIGGHSVDDPEPKYGLVVLGEVHPDRILTNAGLRDGDVLVLTKALGIGIATTAIKAGSAPVGMLDGAVASMTASNAAAARAALAAGATGCTDVSGFGLLGHLVKMAAASETDAVLDISAVPFLTGTRELAASGIVPGGTRRNRDWVAPSLDVGDASELDVLLLADAQTSGGLLFGVAPDRAVEVVAELGATAVVIGTVRAGGGKVLLR